MASSDLLFVAFSIGILSSAAALLLIWRNAIQIQRLREQFEDLADENWRLRERAERDASFLNTQGDFIVRRDAEGRITFVNDAFCSLAGRAAEDLIGTAGTLPLLTERDASAFSDAIRIYDQEVATDEGPRWVAWRDVVVTDPVTGESETQSVGHDVTERIEAERVLAEARDAAESGSRAKSRFLAAMSHEVRTPLNGILGMSDLLLQTSLTPEQTTYVDAVRTSGRALLGIVEDVLDFSRIEAGKLELAELPFSMAALVEEVVELLAPRAQAKGLEIAADADERLPALVVGDAARLRQVLLNLAGNAVKFTEKGGVAIIVEMGESGDEVRFEVQDTGIGIDTEHQARIFDEFEQTDGARKSGGTGLGLAISKGIVERMGGRLAVESRPGEGATFRFSITMPAAESEGLPVTEAPVLSGKSVLLVAGSAAANVIARRLRRWGAMVSTAPNEAVAGALFPERRWDAVIVDRAIGEAAYGVPRTTFQPDTRHVVLLAPGDRSELPALRATGYAAYLIKPVRAASLAAVLTGATGETDAGSASPPVSPSAQPGRAQAGLSVLVAEDNEINALLTRTLLTKLGHRPIMTENGAAALAAWEAARTDGAPFDLVLMDVQMPEMDGLEATRRIRASEGEGPRVRIVGLTANALQEDHAACLEAGMDACLVKPLERDVFLAQLAADAKTSVAA
jgi:PAS domain S-box-containing protein